MRPSKEQKEIRKTLEDFRRKDNPAISNHRLFARFQNYTNKLSIYEYWINGYKEIEIILYSKVKMREKEIYVSDSMFEPSLYVLRDNFINLFYYRDRNPEMLVFIKFLPLELFYLSKKSQQSQIEKAFIHYFILHIRYLVLYCFKDYYYSEIAERITQAKMQIVLFYSTCNFNCDFFSDRFFTIVYRLIDAIQGTLTFGSTYSAKKKWVPNISLLDEYFNKEADKLQLHEFLYSGNNGDYTSPLNYLNNYLTEILSNRFSDESGVSIKRHSRDYNIAVGVFFHYACERKWIKRGKTGEEYLNFFREHFKIDLKQSKYFIPSFYRDRSPEKKVIYKEMYSQLVTNHQDY